MTSVPCCARFVPDLHYADEPGLPPRYNRTGPLDSAFDHLPIIPHEHVADVDCCGCLMVRVREGQADFLSNECGAVVRTVAVEEVEAAMSEMAKTETICSARCPHCGALNTFPEMSAIMAFICSECGEGVEVAPSMQ